MADSAVIFDVDGVLLELTDEEAELFFVPFNDHLDASLLSRDWDSYKIRNDENIVEEILAQHGLDAGLKQLIIASYTDLLAEKLRTQSLATIAIAGAAELLMALTGRHRLGIATANFREAARLRLKAAGFWDEVCGCAFGADGGGHKHDILARAIASTGLPCDRIVYIGDNLNDVDAGLRHNVHFVGFSTDAARRKSLAKAGALHVAGSHGETQELIERFLQP